nr:MAG TPA: hypothetical protein [Caudoviricetes sp.]
MPKQVQKDTHFLDDLLLMLVDDSIIPWKR